MTASINRTQFLSRSVKSGAAVVAAGALLSELAETATAAMPAGDTAYVSLLLNAELLASDFYSRAISASVASPPVQKYLVLAEFNEQQHYASVAGILTGESVTPAVASNFTFTYPSFTFDSEKSIVSFAQQLEATVLGSYLGAIGGMQTSSVLTGLARIAACEAQHSAYFNHVAGEQYYDQSFPPSDTITQASSWIDNYSSSS